jgi:predicted HTH domain antitoxin
MGNVQVRLPDDLEEELEELARELQTNRSETLRRALDEGLESIRLKRAVEAYATQEMTLERAADYAGVSLQRVASAAFERGIPRFRHDSDELDRDVDEARTFLQDESPEDA